MKKTDINDYLFESSQTIGSKEIFHYTSVESMFNIVKSKSLRLSSTRDLNDYKEMKILNDITNIPLLEEKGIPYCNKRIQQIKNIARNDHEVFIISFSKYRDLLSQWRGYADNSRGVSIGFNIDKLRSTLKGLTTKEHYLENINDLLRFRMRSVIYDFQEQCRTFKTHIYETKTDPRSPIKKVNIITTSAGLTTTLSFFKTESFSEEGEVRIVYCPEIELTNSSFRVNGAIKDIDYYCSNGILKPFFILGFNPDIISSITIGANSKLSPYELKRFLVTCGYSLENTKILESKLSYLA